MSYWRRAKSAFFKGDIRRNSQIPSSSSNIGNLSIFRKPTVKADIWVDGIAEKVSKQRGNSALVDSMVSRKVAFGASYSRPTTVMKKRILVLVDDCQYRLYSIRRGTAEGTAPRRIQPIDIADFCPRTTCLLAVTVTSLVTLVRTIIQNDE